VDRELLKAHAGGLIALSGLHRGEIATAPPPGEAREGGRAGGILPPHLRPRNFYLEVQDHACRRRPRSTGRIVAPSPGGWRSPAVATNDSHYLTAEDAEAHDILLCMPDGETVGQEDRLRFPNREFLTTSRPRRWSSSSPHSRASLENTLRIAERLQRDLRGGQYICPLPGPGGGGSPSFFESGWGGLRPAAPGDRSQAREGTLRQPLDAYRRAWSRRIEVIRRMGFPATSSSSGTSSAMPRARHHPSAPAAVRPWAAWPPVPAHHRPRPAAVRPPLRALPQPGAPLPPGHGHRLLQAPPDG